jgi:large subunit ribosomal protein L30
MSEQKQVRGRKKTEPAKIEKAETKAKKVEETPKTPVKADEPKMELLCVIRVRGSVHVRQEIIDTMKMMNLHHINHATLVPNTPQYQGMISKVQSYVSYGPIDRKTLSDLIVKRARITGNKKLTDEFIKENSDFKSIKEFEDAIFSCKANLRAVRGLKPVFRLHPPKGGHKGTIKKTRKEGGILGNVQTEINEFLKRMI